MPPEKPPAKNIAQLLATDRPLRRGDLDATGQADQLAAQIGSFLRNAQTSPPLTIAITGPWGSGKSSVLSRLRDDLVRNKQRPVWFNAWHRQGEESLFAALMQAVRREAVPSWWSPAGLDVRTRLLFSRVIRNPVGWSLALALVAGMVGFLTAARWPTPVEALAPVHGLLKAEKPAEAGLKLLLAMGWPLTILLGVLIVVAALRDRLSSAGLDPGRLLAAAGKATRWRDLGIQLAFRDRFREALQEVTAALGRRTLTILIDDLDRCRPDQIAEVLEAINFLTDANGCFVAFGFARPQVLAGIGLAHREIAAELAGDEDTPDTRKAYAEDFLRKLIQIEVPVPRFNAPAAERLVDAASEIGAEPRIVRAWLPAVGGLCLALLVLIALWSGEKLYSISEEVWNTARTVSTSSAPKPVLSELKHTPPALEQDQPAASPKTTMSKYFYPGQSMPPAHWVWLTLVAVLGASVFAAILAALRPPTAEDDDTEDFTKALRHWAVAAYEVRQSPREMKRFLNRLRFAAAGRVPDLPDTALVGLAVLKHAGADAELAGIAKDAAAKLQDAIHLRILSEVRAKIEAVTEVREAEARLVSDKRPNANATVVFRLIYKALAVDELAASGLPPFEPSPSQVQAFLALWEGVTVEA